MFVFTGIYIFFSFPKMIMTLIKLLIFGGVEVMNVCVSLERERVCVCEREECVCVRERGVCVGERES